MRPSSAAANFEINEQFSYALQVLEESNKHVFITGRAGTGKSSLLRYFLDRNDLSSTVVLAPTGVAALNVDGETVHHFFRFWAGATTAEISELAFKITNSYAGELYRKIKTIVIDEISMLRADLLDQMDLFLRIVRKQDAPFGAVRIIAFGDLYQLSPVVSKEEKALFSSYYDSPYFFSSKVFARIYEEDLNNFAYIELRHVYRQVEQDFIVFLNKVRTKNIQDNDLELVNSQVADVENLLDSQSGWLFLTTTNNRASAINEIYLNRLKTDSAQFLARSTGDFPSSYKPTDELLLLKIGARVMLLTNDSHGRWVNGTMGTVSGIGNNAVSVQIDDGAKVEVKHYTWEAIFNEYDPQTNAIERHTLGTFTQLPVRLSWAMTIHKAQGKTFNKIVIDFERSAFAHGQAYVALSRARSISGIALARAMRKADIRLDWRIVKFLTSLQTQIAENNYENEEITTVLTQAIANKKDLKINYLKADNTHSTRVVSPKILGIMGYAGKEYLGLTAFCHTRGELRNFNIARILSVEQSD